MTKIIAHATHAKDDVERATLPFILANVAATADQDAAVFLTIDAVRLATKGYADDMQQEGYEPLAKLIASFVENGGEIWACGACTKPRGITDGDLIPGARIVTAAFVVEQMAAGAATLGW